MPRRPPRALVWLLLVAVGLTTSVAGAQGSRETQRKLDRIKRELSQVAAQRRQIEGQRSAVSTQLRAVDEQLGHSSRALGDTEANLTREQTSLAQLQQRRDALQSTLGARRVELAQLLRAAYRVGRAAPLKLMLSQDSVADANRVLTWHRYLQRERAQRIATLTTQLHEVDVVERQITAQRSQLDATRVQQRAQLAQLQHDRQQRAQVFAQLDQRYQDRRQREQVLGSDAKSLEQLLVQLRAAAAREAQRRAAAARAAERAQRDAAQRNSAQHTGTPRDRVLRNGALRNGMPAGERVHPLPAPVIANATPIHVGGLGWPLSGTLLAGFGAALPDGGASSGLLIAAPAGTQVRAVANGKVVFADWMNGYGNILIIDHGGGTMSLYAHNEAFLHDTGDDVSRGDAVTRVGSSGSRGQPALYFELRRNGRAVDPRSWLQQR